MIWASADSDKDWTRYLLLWVHLVKSLPFCSFGPFSLFSCLSLFLRRSVKNGCASGFRIPGIDNLRFRFIVDQELGYIRGREIPWQGIDYELKILMENRLAFL